MAGVVAHSLCSGLEALSDIRDMFPRKHSETAGLLVTTLWVGFDSPLLDSLDYSKHEDSHSDKCHY